jgi:predicted permease
MSFLKKLSDFYDRASSVLSKIFEYLVLIFIIALLGGALFDLVQKVPPEGGSSSGGILVVAPTASYQFQAETYIMGALLVFGTIGFVALFKAANVVGEKRYATALGLLGLLSIIITIIGTIYFASLK